MQHLQTAVSSAFPPTGVLDLSPPQRFKCVLYKSAGMSQELCIRYNCKASAGVKLNGLMERRIFAKNYSYNVLVGLRLC